MAFDSHPTARYLRLHVDEARGGFGSGQQLYVFRQEGSDWHIPGDINNDRRLDENDFTSYLNYTGLRLGDGDFEGYVSVGDINGNGLIDAYDISHVGIELEGGVDGEGVLLAMRFRARKSVGSLPKVQDAIAVDRSLNTIDPLNAPAPAKVPGEK